MHQKDGGIIKEGYNEDVDKFRRARTDGKTWLSELEARERERTGIKNHEDQIQQRVWLLSGGYQYLIRIRFRKTISASRH